MTPNISGPSPMHHFIDTGTGRRVCEKSDSRQCDLSGLVKTDRVLQRFGNPDDVNSGTPQAQALNYTATGASVEQQLQRYPFSAGDPEDIARIALFLASDEARMITGAIIPADGGLSAY
jgi:NAD(P)-dependent dehydrogenase (short-subunit alcohol dehydrogenase family)